MKIVYLLICISLCLFSCKQEKKVLSETNILETPWDTILQYSEGTDVNLVMWQGDPFINKYMDQYVVPTLKEKYNIDLNISPGQGNDIVKMTMTSKEAGQTVGKIDMCWINGETFYQLRQTEGLFGPFVNKLPNSAYVNFENPFIGIDFQQKIEGYESPWGNVQSTLIYDTIKVPHPPTTLDEFIVFVKSNPGKFTIPYEFTGLTLLKSWLIAIAGGEGSLSGDFNEIKYQQYSSILWNKINEMKPYLWKKGNTFPNTLSQLHQMFSNGEVSFTMSNNDAEVDNKVLQKLFPESSKAYVLSSGSIQNSHYMGIFFNAPNKAASMVVCNFLMSAEAQYEKMKPEIWGDGTIIDLNKLSPDWQQKFENIPTRKYAPKRSDIQQYALMEIAPEYMIRMFDDFRKYVIEK